jgi:hypothetical protein
MAVLLQNQGILLFAGCSFLFLTVLFGLNRLATSVPSPVNKVAIRWLRLVWVGLFLAYVFELTFFGGVPYWRLWVMGILTWLLADSVYLWLYILAWDKSDLPLFPSIREVDAIAWPANKRFFTIKDWIRGNAYQEVGNVEYYHEDAVLQQVVLYESPCRRIRLQVIILTDGGGVILDQVAFVSETAEGQVLVTDNVFLPYGGVYPEKWSVRRFPAVRRVHTLAVKHLTTLGLRDWETVVPMDAPAKGWVLKLQNALECANVEAGILNAVGDRDEYGKMTGEGRYRIWKEMLLLNYLAYSGIRG